MALTQNASPDDFRIDDPDATCLDLVINLTVTMKKTPAPKGQKVVSKTVDSEVLPDSMKLSDFVKESAILARTKDLIKMENADLNTLAAAIILSAEEVDEFTRDALATACLAIMNAWNCGGLLNFAKRKIKHGEFEKWFHKSICLPSLHLRTAQRYMQLAAKHPNLQELLASQPSLRQAYIASGILPEPPIIEKDPDLDEVVAARVGLLKSVASVQSKLHRFSTKKIKLDAITRKELKAAKVEIDQLFKSLIG